MRADQMSTTGKEEPLLAVSIELAAANWKIALHDGQREKPAVHAVARPQATARLQAVLSLIEQHRQKWSLPAHVRIVISYEAGRDAFWILRALQARHVECYVVDPASIPVERHKRRAKTDRLDAIKLLINLRAWLRGERDRMRVVHMPSPQDEASRHLMRDRGQLQKEVLQHRDRMSKLLRTLGCWDEVDDKVFAGRLRQLLALRRLTIASATPNLRTQSMIENDLTFLPLRVTRVGVGGKRSFDPADKRRLVDACLQPGASLTGLAVKAGVNANQLRKWVGLREQQTASARGNTTVGFPAFVPVVAIDDAAPVPPCRRRHTLRGPRLNWIERTCRHRRYRVRDCRPDCPTA